MHCSNGRPGLTVADSDGRLLLRHSAGHTLQAIVSFHGLLHSKPLKTHEDGSPNFAAGRISDEDYASDFFNDVNTYDTECKVLIENGNTAPRPADPQSSSLTFC